MKTTQSRPPPDDLWAAIAALSGEQLHTIVDIAPASPNAPTDLASFRDRILGVFGNVAGFDSTPPSESVMQALWETYRLAGPACSDPAVLE
ncbi:hypothetical protein [Cupriavidus necator]|uniref:hypothetical protein n=1 Tax=Cupriavidus necator TaxID=106590 RepID=UPI00339D2EB9